MRIYKGKYYIEESIPGISGFQRWNERQYRVMNGKRAANRKINIITEFKFNGGKFKIENGRCPEYQPVTGLMAELYEYLDKNYDALILTPEAYRLKSLRPQIKGSGVSLNGIHEDLIRE